MHAFEHAPVEVTLSVLLAIAFSWTISTRVDPFPEWFEVAVILLLSGAAAFVATMLHALGALGVRGRWIVTASGAVAAALYGRFALDLELEAQAWRAAALVAAAALIVLGAPALAARSGRTERFRRVTGRLVLRMIGVLLYAAALFAGLALALGAVNTLFELDLDARIYLHTFGWVFMVLVTWVVMGGVPDYVRPAEQPGAVGSAVHRMSAFLVTPLLAIYYLILYAYAVRIAITGELPKNLVSPLVIAAGLIAAIALVLFDRADDERRSFRSLRAAAPLFVPLSVLGAAAIVLRLNQYGWTEFRGLRLVLLAVLGLLALGAVVMVLQRRPLPLHVLPLALAAALVLSVVGPWSVIALARRSQQARLSAALAEAGLDWNSTAVQDSIIEAAPFRQMHETSRYLLTHFGRDALPPLLARHADARFVDVVHQAGLRADRPYPSEPRGGFAQLDNGAVLKGAEGGSLHYVRLDHAAMVDTLGSELLTLPIRIGGSLFIADLASMARAIGSQQGERRIGPEWARVELRDTTGARRGELFVFEIGIRSDSVTQIFRLVGVARLE
ncbi:MAG TPA: DUF4153 domain-containing protein [Longimicrobiales bacterium]